MSSDLLPLSVRGLRPESRKIDRDLWLWFCEAKKDSERYDGPRVTKRLVQAKAKQAFEAAGICNFKASDGWYFRWLKRWHRLDLNYAERLKDKNQTGSNGARGPTKQVSRILKAKTFKGLNHRAVREGSTGSNCSEADEAGSSVGPTTSKSSNLYLEVPMCVSDETQVFNENGVYDSFSLEDNSVFETEILCDSASHDFTDSFLIKHNTVKNGAEHLETAQVEEELAPGASSLVNLDDITWNDMPDLSCFDRPVRPLPLKKTLPCDNFDENFVYFPKIVSRVSKFGKAFTIQSGVKLPVKGKGKSFPPLLSAVTEAANSARDKKLQVKSMSYVFSNQDGSCQPSSSSAGSSFEKKSIYAAKSGNGSKHLTVNAMNPARQEVSNTPMNSKSASKHFPASGKTFTFNRASDFRFGRVCGKGTRGNTGSHPISRETPNHIHDGKYSDFERNFVHHDFEDVSVSSDFVNHLNDENSLDLNLEYGNDMACHQISLKTSINNSNQIVEEDSGGFINLISSNSSDAAMSTNSYERSEPDCHMSVPEDDLSGEENDYISEAVILSMQEDDFSILNCDQSPFQGTISVIDENSQSESDKIHDLESALILDKNEFESGEILFPPPDAPTYNAPRQENKFRCRGKAMSERALLDESSSICGVGQTDLFQDKFPQEQQECFVYSHSTDNDHVASQNILHLTSLSSEKQVNLGMQDILHNPSSVDGIATNGILDPSMYECTVNPEELLVSNSCSLSENVREAPCMFLPCGSEEIENADYVTHFSGSNTILGNPDETDLSFQHEVTIANADATSLLLSPSSMHSHSENVSQLIKLSASNTFALRSSQSTASPLTTQRSCHKSEIISLSTNLDSCVLENLSNYDAICPVESSSSPLTCESLKENGLMSYDLQLVESVLSEQDDAPGSLPKSPKKNTAYLTEKENNTNKSTSAVEENQLSYRRSSGDRYFPYFKERVANYAIKHTAKEAARYFGVNVDTVTMWTRARHETDSVVKNYPDQLMLRWLKKNRESGILLTHEQVVEKAAELLKTPGSWVKDKTRWFQIWALRLVAEEDKKKSSNNNSQDVAQLPIDRGEKKALYPEEFKVEVALYAEQTSKNLASSVFKIARKRVYEWSAALKVTKNTEKDEPLEIADADRDVGAGAPQMTPDSKKFKLNGKGMGRAVTSVAVDHELWLWFCEQTAKKSKPKSKEIRAKAVELFRSHNHDKIKCSHGWLKKWSLRYGIALRYEGDNDLVAWCLEQFDHNRNISHRDLLNYAQELLTGTHKSEFKASAGWLVRFCKRHKNLLSTKPSIDIEIPTVLKQKVSEFRSNVQKAVYSSNIPLGNVGCLDEVPLNFTAGGSRSRLLLRRSGLENCHAIVILSCLGNGELLPPALIFKGEGPPEEITHGDISILSFYQKDCCMSASIMSQWLDLVWIKHVTSPSVLVADCDESHTSELVREKCLATDVALSIIPAGCSFKLQPLDLAISQLFEANIYNRWTKHFTAADQISACKRTSYSNNADIVNWVAEAYRSLKQARKEAIRRSFLVTGLISALDGTDDHLLEDPSCMPVCPL